VPTLSREQRAAELASRLTKDIPPTPCVIEVAVSALAHASLYGADRAAAWTGYVAVLNRRDSQAAGEKLAVLFDGRGGRVPVGGTS
jgi:hypothetical protein